MKKHRIRRNIFYRLYMWCRAFFAACYFGFPSRGMECYAITGTDGKSTSNEILYHLLKQAGKSVGIISTVSIDVGDGRQSNETKLTSLSHRDLQKYLRKAKNNGVKIMVIEASSHALHQFRLWPIRFRGVGLTNLTREHLDFHRTMEHYGRTKLRLFSDHITKNAIGVLPASFSYKKLTDKYVKVHTLQRFGYDNNADIRVDAINNTPLLEFDLHYKGKQASIRTKMHGSFNAENMMIATVLAMHAGVDWESVCKGLESFGELPGRQEIIKTSNNVHVMIDFALTPDGFKTLYSAMRACGYERLIAVFGATGERDVGKRPKMGAVAAEYCDYVVLTEDENYSEDGMKIMKQVEEGIIGYKDAHPQEDTAWTLIQDRAKAIEHSIEVAQPGDLIMVTGMANFSTRAMNEGKIPRDEKEVIKDAMKKLGVFPQ